MTVYNKDIVTDFGAVGDGITNCCPAWQAFNYTFIAGLSAGDVVNLNIPAGTYLFAVAGLGGICYLAPGCLGGLTINNNGAGRTNTILLSDLTTSGYKAGGGQFPSDFVHGSKINSVSKGSTSVQLKTPAEASRFTVGQWVEISGLELQGPGNYPPNHQFYDFAQITSIDTSGGNAIIHFTPELTENYLDTWPDWSDYLSGHGYYLGGPASIFPLPFNWDVSGTFNDLKLDQAGGSFLSGKNFVFNNCATGANITSPPGIAGCGIVPTLCLSATFNNLDQSLASSEVDKCNGTLTWNGSTILDFHNQSAGSAKQMIIDNTTFLNSTSFNGTPRNLIIRNGSSIQEIGCGPLFGATDSITVTDSTVTGIFNGISSSGIGDIEAVGVTCSGGVITIPNSFGAPEAQAIPGRYMAFDGAKATEYIFKVLDVAFDGSSNQLIYTDIPGGMPNIPASGGGTHALRGHPCLVWHGSNNTGCPDILDLNQAGAQGKPLFSYSKRNYKGTTPRTGDQLPLLVAGGPSFSLWGRLSAINVTLVPGNEYTGVQTLTCEITGQGVNALTPDQTTVLSYDPVVNLKQSGARIITPTTVVSQSGDSLLLGGVAPGAFWFCSNQSINVNHDVSADGDGPLVTIEFIVDQGIVFPQVINFIGDAIAEW